MPDEATLHELLRRGMAEYPHVGRDYRTGRDREVAIAALIGVLTQATRGESIHSLPAGS